MLRDFYGYPVKKEHGRTEREGMLLGGHGARAKRYEIEPPYLQLVLFEPGLINWTPFNKVNGKNDVRAG